MLINFQTGAFRFFFSWCVLYVRRIHLLGAIRAFLTTLLIQRYKQSPLVESRLRRTRDERHPARPLARKQAPALLRQLLQCQDGTSYRQNPSPPSTISGERR